jgi:Zn-dependent protease with chaperone function
VRPLVKALVVVLTVPVVCAALALTSRHELDTRWTAGLRRPFLVRRQVPDERLLARYSLSVVCGDPRLAPGIRPCRPYRLFSSMATAAAATGALGVGFLGAVSVAGAACRARRRRLSRLFRPALYVTVFGLVVLVLLHGALGVASVFLFGEVIQRWPIGLVLALAAATVVAALSMIQLALAVTRRESPAVVARELRPGTQRRLVEWVRGAAESVGAATPAHLLVGLHPAVFVADASIVTLDGRLPGRSLYLPLPLARILSSDELRALVAHELAHVAAPQAADSERVFALHAGVRRTLRVLSLRSSGIAALTALPALSVLSLFDEAFDPAVSSASREREQAADGAAADLAGPATLASALVKAHAFTPAWDAVATAMDRAVIEGTQYENASVLFAQVAAASSDLGRLAGAGGLSLPHPVDVHPSLAERLKDLGVSVGEVSAAALVVDPADPAIALVDGHDAIERDLSQVEQRIAAMTWGPVEDEPAVV